MPHDSFFVFAFPQCLSQSLTFSKCSINMGGMNWWIKKWMYNKCSRSAWTLHGPSQWERIYLTFFYYYGWGSLVPKEQFPTLASLAPGPLGHKCWPNLPQSLEAWSILLRELSGDLSILVSSHFLFGTHKWWSLLYIKINGKSESIPKVWRKNFSLQVEAEQNSCKLVFCLHSLDL